VAFDREKTKRKAAELAVKGVFIGTSSWKYEGWLDQLYTPARYEYRGKVAKTRFERDCLSEYAEEFETVCVERASHVLGETQMAGFAPTVQEKTADAYYCAGFQTEITPFWENS
jgi:hypothetical protein